ncbi:MAG: bifunctional methionine sulfoxide reductase B/A protein [Planctomycetia bacterium]|nr:bifunctional methionine sulfoxide reductase B/A protein [Planctomycetia bacterium]MCK6465667.1 bifunctional methionine sulfoxide reductase B/A protein [Phycisphaerae bacterium]NUQ09285.1 bifunctional methionine sulfoxide reductase B/A protein [Phycisphaerae bacterium]
MQMLRAWGVVGTLTMTLALAGCRRADAQVQEGSGGKARTPGGQDTQMKIRYSKSGYDITPLPREQVAELAKKLDPEAYRITQSAATERPFCGTLLDNKKDGVYVCVVCGLPLFSSEHKFNSGTGWPSFYREFDPEHVARKADHSHGMIRTEINCARCDAHLGHVFEDGPKPTGERHCLNSASLTFYEKGQELPAPSRPAELAVAYFAGGCFWGLEHYFQKGPGVIDAVSGYMQGKTDNPTYKDVCDGRTRHAETVKVVYDPKRISYRQLLDAFFKMHDPTQLDRQGPDVGDQYRSGIWTVDEDQKREAELVIRQLENSARFSGRKIVTQVEPAKTFYPAEEYHQDYIVRTGRACHVTNPW